MDLSEWFLLAITVGFILFTPKMAIAQGSVGAAPQQGTPNSEAVMLYNEAGRLASTHHESDALPKLKRAIELDPSFSMAQFGYGTILLNMGQPSEAILRSGASKDLNSDPMFRLRTADSSLRSE